MSVKDVLHTVANTRFATTIFFVVHLYKVVLPEFLVMNFDSCFHHVDHRGPSVNMACDLMSTGSYMKCIHFTRR